MSGITGGAAIGLAGQINANPDLLERVARELDRVAQDIHSEERRLRAAGEETRAAWQSQHTGQFLASVDATSRRAGRCAEQVRQAATRLRAIAAEIRRVEREIQRMKTGR